MGRCRLSIVDVGYYELNKKEVKVGKGSCIGYRDDYKIVGGIDNVVSQECATCITGKEQLYEMKRIYSLFNTLK